MTNAIETINAKLAEVFAEMDIAVAAKARTWGIARRDAIAAKREELSGQRRAMGEWAYYDKLFAAAGGKSWYGVLGGLNDAGVVAVMDKNSAAVAAKRNATISAKLAKAEVTEVLESTYSRTNDGFDGTFVVMTNKGKKVVTINSIYAGGYNIQCFHVRVLVKVK